MKLLELTYTLENILRIISEKFLKDKKETPVPTKKSLSDLSKSLLSIKNVKIIIDIS